MGLCVSETCLTVETRRTFRDILVKEKFVVVVVFFWEESHLSE